MTPFTVLENRETLGGELLLVWDPTPGTWFHKWDNEYAEDASLAGSLDFWYKHHPTTRDSNVFISDTGDTVPFGVAPDPADEWLATASLLSSPFSKTRFSTAFFVGQKQPNNGEARDADDLAVGGKLRVWLYNWHFDSTVAFNDWGPFDFHRDFNLIYPFQSYLDASWGLQPAGYEVRGTRIGMRGQLRTLDVRSLDYVEGPRRLGLEWEVGLYATIELGGASQ